MQKNINASSPILVRSLAGGKASLIYNNNKTKSTGKRNMVDFWNIKHIERENHVRFENVSDAWLSSIGQRVGIRVYGYTDHSENKNSGDG
jgi:hypothetical protein